MRTIVFFLMLVLGSCHSLPRDAAGTVERIERTGTMRIAIVSGTRKVSDAQRIADRFASMHAAKSMVGRAGRTSSPEVGRGKDRLVDR